MGQSTKQNQGEAAGRKRGLEDKGGERLVDIPKEGDLRGQNEEGRHSTGTHGGPSKEGTDANTRKAGSRQGGGAASS